MNYPNHLELLETDLLEDVDFTLSRDGCLQRQQLSAHIVSPTHPFSPWRHVVVSFIEYSQGKRYKKIAIARYRKLKGSWHCVALIKVHPDEVHELCRSLIDAKEITAREPLSDWHVPA